MTEILTESFCERCGTRYTFESSAPRKSRLGRVRMLSKGVRNFVMSDESSFSEAMAEARSEEELAATAHQLDAFHQTFNFCLTCRQYTCGDCWNTPEGRCLTCAPVPGQPEPAARLDLGDMPPVPLGAGVSGNGHEQVETPDGEEWPEMDLPTDRLERMLGLPAAEPVPAEAAATTEVETPGEVEAGAPAEVPAEVEAEAHPQVLGVSPGQSLDDAIAAYEASVAAEEAVAEEAVAAEGSEPIVAAAEPGPAVAEPEPAIAEPVSPEPEPVAAAVAPEAPPTAAAEPEPVAAAPEPAAATVEPEPAAERAAASEDHVSQPTWPVAPAPAAPAAPTPAHAPAPAATPSPWLTVAPDDASAPQWPATPQWRTATPRRDVPMTLAGRPLLPQADTSALWAASAQEVLGAAPAPLAAAAPVAAQPCTNCGLSLSANARFCRRCGSRQG